MEGTIVAVGETEIAGVWNEADAEFVVRAVNTFDQAREALEELIGDLDDGIRDELGTGGVSGATLVRARQALAAMEAP